MNNAGRHSMQVFAIILSCGALLLGTLPAGAQTFTGAAQLYLGYRWRRSGLWGNHRCRRQRQSLRHYAEWRNIRTWYRLGSNAVTTWPACVF
jgi:hypothetical protein